MQALVTLILSLFFISLSHANDAAFGGSGALPMPIKESRIAMVSEKITIDGSHLSQENMSGRWHYRCEFNFLNTANKSIDLTMGFPFPINEGLGDIATPKGVTVNKGDPLVYDFRVSMAGKRLVSKKQAIAPDEERELFYTQAYLWPMHFKPRQTIKLTHQYSSGVTQDVMGYDWVTYVLKTGSLWKDGKIGETLIEVTPNTPSRLCYEINKESYLKPQPLGLKIVGKGAHRKYVWKLKQFTPNKDVNLCLMTANNFVLYKVVYPIISNPEQLKARLKKLSTPELRILRNSIYARHGRLFKSALLKRHFKAQWWYQANPNYADSMLDDDDKKAIAIILSIEKR